MDREIGICDGLAWEYRFHYSYFTVLKHSFYLGLAIVFDFYIFPLAKTVNSNILQYRLESLTRRTSYSLQVMASTNAGGTNGTKINFKTLSISEYFLYTLARSSWHFH